MNFNNQGILGFDLSKYQDSPATPAVIDFQKMRDFGASFVIIRVGQGNFIDRVWKTNATNAKGILPRGAYWFFDPYYSPIIQADMCLEAVLSERIEGRLWLDLEFWWQGDYTAPRHWRTFLDRCKAAGLRTGIYSRASWWREYARDADMTYFMREPSWVAQYPTLLEGLPGFAEPMIHQDGTPSVGLEAGVESVEIDRNWWNGNYEFFNEWRTQPPAEQPEEVTMSTWYRVNATAGLNIRNGAGAGNLDIGDLTYNDRIEVEGAPVSGWLHIKSILRVGSTVQITFDGWCSGAYCVAISPPVIPLPEVPTVTLKHTIDVYSDGSLKIDGVSYP
jgi:GH25 family lysozyme M1 (1,4-beta-N-acetylmuramidase)